MSHGMGDMSDWTCSSPWCTIFLFRESTLGPRMSSAATMSCHLMGQLGIRFLAVNVLDEVSCFVWIPNHLL
jgi:hypothetical protein